MKYKISALVLFCYLLTSIAFAESFKPLLFAQSNDAMPNTSFNPRPALKPTPTPTPEATPTPTPTPEETATPTPTPSPTPDLELEKITREANLAAQKKAKTEAERDAAKAEVEKAKAQLGLSTETPQASATPVSGNVTGDYGKLIETVILTETAAREASVKIADTVCQVAKPKGVNTLVISNDLDMSSKQNYQSVLAQVQAINTSYDGFLEEFDRVLAEAEEVKNTKGRGTKAIPPILAIPAATQIVKSAADFINLFRTETEYKSVDVTSVNEQMIATFLANELLMKPRTDACTVKSIYYPKEFPLNISTSGGTSPLLKAFNSLKEKQIKGDQKATKAKEYVDLFTAELEKLEEEMKALEGKNDSDSQDERRAIGIRRAKYKKIIEQLNQLIRDQATFKTNIADLIKMFSEINSTTKLPVLTEFLKAERLVSLLDSDKTYAMDMTVTAAGMVRIRRNIFFNANVAHSGGASISVRFFDKDSQLIGGDVQDYYIDFVGSKTIRKSLNFKKLSEIRPKP